MKFQPPDDHKGGRKMGVERNQENNRTSIKSEYKMLKI